MRIWLAPSAFAPHRGGVEELTLKIGQHLQRRGNDVLVITQRHPADLPQHDLVDGLPVFRVAFTAPGRHPLRLLGHYRQRPRLTRTLTALPKPDVIHVICASVQLPALGPFARTLRVPLVITTQGETAMDANHIYQRSRWLRRSLNREAARADALTACSRWTADHARTIAPAFDSARIIYNGVDPDDWADLGVPSTEPVVVAWGRHVRQKGFDLLLESFALVREKLPEARLLIGGDGPEFNRLQSMAGDGVEFVGSLDRSGVRRLLARARVVAVPSRIEPFGIVAVEALAAGRGLVWSTRGGLAEASGGHGHGADPQDRDALARAIIAELLTPTSSGIGRCRAEQLSWERLVDRYDDLYAELTS